jgi:hypothetical protein
MRKTLNYKFKNKIKAEEICINYYRGGGLSEENSDFLIDYLSDRDLDEYINQDSSNEDICNLVIRQKMNDEDSLEDINDYIGNIKSFRNINQYQPELKRKENVKSFRANIPIDLYLQIALESDWQTIKNMIIANNSEKFNETFFKLLLQKRYPLLLKYKPEYETYKKYFLKVIYALAKLSEDFEFPYIPNKNFNPIEFYKTYKGLKNSIFFSDIKNLMFKNGLSYAGEIGDINLINYFLEKIGVIDLNNHSNLLGGQEMAIKQSVEKSLLNEQLDTIKYFLNRNLITEEYLRSILSPFLPFQMNFSESFKKYVSPKFYSEFQDFVNSLS